MSRKKYIQTIFLFKVEASDDDVKAFAKGQGVPVVWVACGIDTGRFAVCIEGQHVFRQSNSFNSLYVFLGAFPIFSIDWNSYEKVLSFVSN